MSKRFGSIVFYMTLSVLAGCSTWDMQGTGLPMASFLQTDHSNQLDRQSTKRKTVVKRVRLNTNAPKVFAYMTDFEEMEKWMPGLKRVEVDNRNSQNGPNAVGVGTQRVCSMLGMEAHEEVIEFSAPHRFAYELTERSSATVPFKSGIGTVQVDPIETGGCIVTYEVQYETKPFHPMSPFMPSMLSKQLDEGLDNLAWQFGGRRVD